MPAKKQQLTPDGRYPTDRHRLPGPLTNYKYRQHVTQGGGSGRMRSDSVASTFFVFRRNLLGTPSRFSSRHHHHSQRHGRTADIGVSQLHGWGEGPTPTCGGDASRRRAPLGSAPRHCINIADAGVSSSFISDSSPSQILISAVALACQPPLWAATGSGETPCWVRPRVLGLIPINNAGVVTLSLVPPSPIFLALRHSRI